jgi:hypothetical protein
VRPNTPTQASARAFSRVMGDLQHDWPKTKVKGGWGHFYRKQQVEKKAAGIDARPSFRLCPFCRVALGDSDVRMR